GIRDGHVTGVQTCALPILISIAFNYGIGHFLIVAKLTPSQRRAALALGVAGDLLVLGIFKYAGFVTENINALAGTHFAVHILLRSEERRVGKERRYRWELW